MGISEVQIMLVKPQNGLVAFASFVLDGQWYMGSIAIMTRLQGGYRLVYPTRKIGSQNLPIYHPITKEQSQAIEEIVITHYEEVATSGRHHSPNHDWPTVCYYPAQPL